jgi:hypothetical protein
MWYQLANRSRISYRATPNDSGIYRTFDSITPDIDSRVDRNNRLNQHILTGKKGNRLVDIDILRAQLCLRLLNLLL